MMPITLRPVTRVGIAFASAALLGASLLTPSTALARGTAEARFDQPFTGFAPAPVSAGRLSSGNGALRTFSRTLTRT